MRGGELRRDILDISRCSDTVLTPYYASYIIDTKSVLYCVLEDRMGSIDFCLWRSGSFYANLLRIDFAGVGSCNCSPRNSDVRA